MHLVQRYFKGNRYVTEIEMFRDRIVQGFMKDATS